MSAKPFLMLGGLAAFLGVAFGAFGAHALKDALTPERMAVWHTAVLYQFVHALGLLAVGAVILQGWDSDLLRWAGWCMAAGIVLFSGSLYALCLSGVTILGAITPFGGTFFLVGWMLFVASVWRH